MTAQDWRSLVEHALWPGVVLILGIVLRSPIATLLNGIAGRVTKLSLWSVSVELAVATETAPPWKGVGGDDVRGLVAAAQVNDSYYATLREALAERGNADYFVVDLRGHDDDEWLTSRLYLFSWLLSRLKGVRSIIFVATRGDVSRVFLAVAPVSGVMRALARAEPWLRIARLEAEAHDLGRLPNPPQPPAGPLPTPEAADRPDDVDDWWDMVRAGRSGSDPLFVAQGFLDRLQWTQPAGVPNPATGTGWLRLPDSPPRPLPTWEHATWLRSSDLTGGVLRDVVDTESTVVVDRTWSNDELVRAITCIPGPSVALLTPNRRFDRLVDRDALLRALGETTNDRKSPTS